MRYAGISLVVLLLVLGLALPQFAQAPQIAVSESVTASGGGSMENAKYLADATIGQPLTYTSGTFSAGFWYTTGAEAVLLPEINVTPANLRFSATANNANPDGQELGIANTGGGILQWTITGEGEWLSVSSESGQCSAGETVKVIVVIDISDLADGTHKSLITVSAENVPNSPQYVEVILDLTPARSVKADGKQTIPLGDLKNVDGDSFLADMPSRSALGQNYPNPLNPGTWIPYQLIEGANATIKIYDTMGCLVKDLELGYRSPGFYTNSDKAAYWDGKNDQGERVASGIYFYRLEAGSFVSVRKLVISE